MDQDRIDLLEGRIARRRLQARTQVDLNMGELARARQNLREVLHSDRQSVGKFLAILAKVGDELAEALGIMDLVEEDRLELGRLKDGGAGVGPEADGPTADGGGGAAEPPNAGVPTRVDP